MASKTYYTGPGKVYFNSLGLFAEGENGQIKIGLNEETVPFGASMFGRIGEQVANQQVELALTPFDSWGLLRTLFPVFTGVSVGASAGALVIGTRAHGAANVPCKTWTPDGRLYSMVRSAVVGHPTLHLGIGQPLYSEVRIVGAGDIITPVAMGASGHLITGNAITESGAADPGGAFAMSDFIRGAWTGVWGTVAGFGGAAGGDGQTNPIEAETEWTITPDIRYNVKAVQRRAVIWELAAVGFMASCRPVGPTQSDIIARIGAHTHGQRLGSADLTLTGPSSKTITLKNSEVRGAGFEFGGTQLGTGEIGFVNEMTFSAGAPQPLLVFSA